MNQYYNDLYVWLESNEWIKDKQKFLFRFMHSIRENKHEIFKALWFKWYKKLENDVKNEFDGLVSNK